MLEEKRKKNKREMSLVMMFNDSQGRCYYMLPSPPEGEGPGARGSRELDALSVNDEAGDAMALTTDPTGITCNSPGL